MFLPCSVLERPQLMYHVQFANAIILNEKDQISRGMKKIRNLKNVTYEKSLIEMLLFSSEKETYLYGFYIIGINSFPFSKGCVCSALNK